MTYSFQQIQDFIAKHTGCEIEEVLADADIVNDLGCCGDDLSDLLEAYVKEFKVDMKDYLWYFHTEEEGHDQNFGRAFFKAPYERVEHIPITPNLLLASSNSGKWLLTYPEHTLPKRRYDVIFNQVVVVLVIIFLIYKCTTR